MRLYVAPMFGYKSLKWLSAIRVVDRVEPGFWEENGYPVNGWLDGTTGPTEPRPAADLAMTLTRAAKSAVRILRFDRVQRVAHWANALLFGDLILTAVPSTSARSSASCCRATSSNRSTSGAASRCPIPIISL